MSYEPDRSDLISAVSHISLMSDLLYYSLTLDFVLGSSVHVHVHVCVADV